MLMLLNVQNKELSYESYKLMQEICNRTAKVSMSRMQEIF
jgi:hypothetical protein